MVCDEYGDAGSVSAYVVLQVHHMTCRKRQIAEQRFRSTNPDPNTDPNPNSNPNPDPNPNSNPKEGKSPMEMRAEILEKGGEAYVTVAMFLTKRFMEVRA
jgi:hypothetical protein